MKNKSVIINKIVKRKILFLFGLPYLSILFYSCSLHTTVVVRGNADTAPFGFTTAINTTVFDCRTGTFYVGLQANGSNTESFAVSKGPRPNFNKSITFTGIAVDTGNVQLTNQPIEFLAL